MAFWGENQMKSLFFGKMKETIVANKLQHSYTHDQKQQIVVEMTKIITSDNLITSNHKFFSYKIQDFF
jgi:hypothetical protein